MIVLALCHYTPGRLNDHRQCSVEAVNNLIDHAAKKAEAALSKRIRPSYEIGVGIKT
jgi:hypothetical protein